MQRPVAMKLAGGDEMIAAGREAGVLLKVLENFVFYPPYRRAKEILASGEIGEPLCMRTRLAAGYGGWTYLAENLYRGSLGQPVAGAVQAWTTSAAHLSAMLSDAATEIGAACSVSGQYLWCVQEFGAR